MIVASPAIILPPEKPAIVRASDLRGLPSWQEVQRREQSLREGTFPFPVFIPRRGTSQIVSGSVGTTIGDMTALGGLAAAVDGVTSQNDAASACATSTTSSYVGKNYTSPGAKVIDQVVVFPSNQSGLATAGTTVTLNLRAKQTAPSSAADAGSTILGTATQAKAVTTSKTVTNANDRSTAWLYVWIEIAPDASANTLCAEAQFYELI